MDSIATKSASRPTLLVVEDDAGVRNLIATTLEAHGYRHVCAGTGRAAIAAATSQAPDIVLLDLGLPDMDGVEVVRSVRSWSQMPIIVVSARTEDADKIRALDAGADDYLTKPFSVGKFLARIRTTLRRLSHQAAEGPAPAPAFDNGELHVDFAAGTASLAGRELHLTPMEYKLLCLLARNVGRVLTHQFILREVWDTTSKSDLASLRVIMGTLRKNRGGPGPPSLHPDTRGRGLPHAARLGRGRARLSEVGFAQIAHPLEGKGAQRPFSPVFCRETRSTGRPFCASGTLAQKRHPVERVFARPTERANPGAFRSQSFFRGETGSKPILVPVV